MTDNAWMDDKDVTLLNGDPIPENMDFPVDPAVEIGRVRAVFSTCVKDKPLRSGLKRFLMVVAVFLLIAISVTAAIGGNNGVDAWVIGSIFGIGAGFFISLIVVYYTRGSNWLAYVGENGLVKYKLGSDRSQIKKTELFEFIHAADLYTHTVSQSVNLIYVGTHYNYEWRDDQGKRVFRLSGSHNSKKGTPKRNSPYYLATAGEAMWTMFLGQAVNIELEEQGAVHFKVNKKDWVRVGPGFMEFNFKGKPARLAVDEIKDLRVGGGHFAIRSQDAGWLGGKGKYGFEYSKMANARLFLMCLEQLCGYSFG